MQWTTKRFSSMVGEICCIYASVCKFLSALQKNVESALLQRENEVIDGTTIAGKEKEAAKQ
jgi:hypothetical protein